MSQIDDKIMSAREDQGEPAPGSGSRLPASDDPISAAREYLTATVSAVHPGLSARRLLFYAERNRAHLATVLAAIERGYVPASADAAPTA